MGIGSPIYITLRPAFRQSGCLRYEENLLAGIADNYYKMKSCIILEIFEATTIGSKGYLNKDKEKQDMREKLGGV